MSAAAQIGALRAPPASVRSEALAAAALWICAFSGFFVLMEPAPYDLVLATTIAMTFLAGLPLIRPISPLVVLMLLYVAGGLLSSTQVPVFDRAPMYMAVSCFLGVTAVFYAAVVARFPRVVTAIASGYVVGALLAALAGIAGYFNLVPGSDTFTLYGRARGTFEDPNVFGPFLIFPIALLSHAVLIRPLARAFLPASLLAVLLAAVFLAFSRATWAMVALTMLATGVVVFANERRPLARLRLGVLALVGAVALVVVLALAIQSSAIHALFTDRAELVQAYDAARLGRFARHGLGFLLASERPLGIGPLEFYKIFSEDPHNMYLKSFIAYGWLGGFSYLLLMLWTLIALFPLMFKPRPTRAVAIAVFLSLVAHAINGLVIDMDHWRHFYLLYGVAWGLLAHERARPRKLPSWPDPARVAGLAA